MNISERRAAFQHKVWAPHLEPLFVLATTRIVLCNIGKDIGPITPRTHLSLKGDRYDLNRHYDARRNPVRIESAIPRAGRMVLSLESGAGGCTPPQGSRIDASC